MLDIVPLATLLIFCGSLSRAAFVVATERLPMGSPVSGVYGDSRDCFDFAYARKISVALVVVAAFPPGALCSVTSC